MYARARFYKEAYIYIYALVYLKHCKALYSILNALKEKGIQA